MRDFAAAAERLHDARRRGGVHAAAQELAPQGRHRDDVAIVVVRRLA